MFKNPFSFGGRIRRTEYVLSYIAYIVALMIVVGLLGVGTGFTNGIDTIMIFMIYIPLIWFLLAQGAKRCHDRGNSGWWQIIPFYFFWLVFADGDIGPNEYGENPKGHNYEYESYDTLKDQFNPQKKDAGLADDE